LIFPKLLGAEGRRADARRELEEIARAAHALHAGQPEDLLSISYLSDACRQLAAITTGQERRDALLKSAAAWHSWPATTFTRREEQKDIAAATR
jgi:hypothetical protein